MTSINTTPSETLAEQQPNLAAGHRRVADRLETSAGQQIGPANEIERTDGDPICPICWYGLDDYWGEGGFYDDLFPASEEWQCGRGHPVQPVTLALAWVTEVDGELRSVGVPHVTDVFEAVLDD